MASTYLIAPSPKWYFLDAFGAQASGGKIITTSSLDHTTPKFVFSDPGGNFPYLDPIILDDTGGSPVPMYWEINGVDLYYLVGTDKNGNIILAMDNFPLVGGGGSTPVTSNIDIENHIINGQFIFIDALNSADSTINPIPLNTPIRLAPASGFFKDAMGNYVSNYLDGHSGWLFEMDGGTGQTALIQFVDVTAIGTGIPSAPSANATRFFRYELQIAGGLQTAAFLYQTVPQVETFSGELLTITFDTRTTAAGNPQGTVEVFQDFGTGGDPGVPSTVNFNFSSGSWARQMVQLSVASVVGKMKGISGDDHIELIWNFPLNTLGAFEITNLQVQRGNFGLTPYIYQDYNQDQYKVLIDLIQIGNAVFPTGEIKWVAGAPGGVPIAIPGWILLSNVNETLGSAASGANFAGNSYKNLYILWWNSFPQLTPGFSTCLVIGGRGVSALADFNANKQMRIPSGILGTVLAGAGLSLFGSLPFAFLEGERTHVLTEPEMPTHVHSSLVPVFNDAQSGADQTSVTGGTTGPAGGGLAHNNMQPTTYVFIYAKL